MNNWKGTKGKWELQHYTNKVGFSVYSDDGCIAERWGDNGGNLSNEKHLANAKLIAAAPDLLEALMSIENDKGIIPKAIWDMRNKAIEKALK